jgi:hypothetical protein
VLPAEFVVVIGSRMLAAPLAPPLPVVDVYTEPSLFPPTMMIEADPEYDVMMTCMPPDCVGAVRVMVTPRSVPAGPDVCGTTRVGATLLPVAVSMCVTVKVLWAATELATPSAFANADCEMGVPKESQIRESELRRALTSRLGSHASCMQRTKSGQKLPL